LPFIKIPAFGNSDLTLNLKARIVRPQCLYYKVYSDMIHTYSEYFNPSSIYLTYSSADVGSGTSNIQSN